MNRTHVFGSVALFLAAFCVPSTALAQSTGVLSASNTFIVVNSPTSVAFTLSLPADASLLPTSVNLQRQVSSGWTVVGRLYDDGTHGDVIAGDNNYTLLTTVNEPSLGTLSYRGSSAYLGTLARKLSNSVQLSIVPSLDIIAQSGATDLTVVQGSTANLVTAINVIAIGYGTLNVRNATTITPATGLTMTSDYPSGGWTTSTSKSFVVNQQFTGLAIGDYVVQNVASITGTTLTSTATFDVHVIPPGGDPMILPLGAAPDGVQVDVPTYVVFTATIANFTTAPASLDLVLLDGSTNPVVAQLKDDGTGGDMIAGDGVYSGTLPITSNAEGVTSYVAKGTFPGVSGQRVSAPFGLVTIAYPPTIAPSDFSKTISDPASGQQMIGNEVLVTFNTPQQHSAVEAFASTFGATVVGTLPGLGIYQLQIPNPANTLDVLQAALAAMAAYPGVSSAVPNLIGSITEVTPNDPGYGLQYAPQKIRADEAWVIARGGPLVAVIDTGVNYNHEDLAGVVIKGRDFVNADNDPMDDMGHGTHCAGIVAASGNNGKGIAGIAWTSKVLAIKSLNSTGNGTMAQGAAAIKWAADKGAKVISCSWGWTPGTGNLVWAWLVGLEDAVDYATAKGSIVVVAAGNENSTAIRVPGRYTNSFCVGSTTSSDTRSSFSCFGPQVDIAAPGSAIYSTLMGGGYGNMSGTSMATPCVSGALAVLWSRFPAYTAAQVKERMQRTAVPLPGLQLGAGRVDLFEAVFNGSFEDGTTGWNVTGTAGAVTALGPLTPTDRSNFGFASSGPDNAQVQTTMQQSFTIQPGVTAFKLTFDYDFVTEEYPEWVGSIYNDNMRIELVDPAGVTHILAAEAVNSSSFTPVGGIDFPGGDSTVGHTGWKTVSTSIPVTQGSGNYRIIVRDEGDGIYDSNVLIDRIRFKY